MKGAMTSVNVLMERANNIGLPALSSHKNNKCARPAETI